MHECQCCIFTTIKNRATRNWRWRGVHAVVPERPRTIDVDVDEWEQQDLLAGFGGRHPTTRTAH